MGDMSERKFHARLNFSYTFDGRPLRGLGEQGSVLKN